MSMMTPRFYIWPPHPSPTSKIMPDDLDKYEKTGDYIAQRKFNGGRAVIIINNGKLSVYNRHREPFTTLRLTSGLENCFASLKLDKRTCYVFDGEWLGTKAVQQTTGKQAQTETIVLFDILYLDKHLIHLNQVDRLELLNELCGKPCQLEPKKRGLSVAQSQNANLWLAENFIDEFEYHFYEMFDFDELKNDLYPEIEGLVLRRKLGKLKLGHVAYDTSDIVRCRKTKPNMYQF